MLSATAPLVSQHAPAPSRASSRGVPSKIGKRPSLGGARGHRRVVVAPLTAIVAPDWATLDQLTAPIDVGTYNVRPKECQPLPRQVPSSSTDPSLPTSRNSAATDKRVLLYRDTNAWCPFCERVWLALLEKDIPFDTVFIDLRNKPQWYLDMVPSKLVPAVRIDGELVVESRDILLAIEAAFPESTPLLPPARTSERARVEALMDLADDSEKGVGSAGYRFLTGGGMFGGVRDESDVPKLRAAFEERLESLESALAAAPHGGPFLGGAAPSLADLMMAPSLERFAANLPAFRGFDLRAQPGLPRLAAWYDAMEARPSYSTVRGDPGTHNVVVRKLFRLQAGAAGEAKPEEALGAGAGTGAGEAARKLVVNHEAVAADVVKNAGIGGDAVEVRAEVESALRSLAARLAAVAGIEAPVAEAVAEMEEKAAPASGPPSAEQKAAAARASAVAAATWAFMRQRVSAPRDMSGAAASALRAASLCAIAELDF